MARSNTNRPSGGTNSRKGSDGADSFAAYQAKTKDNQAAVRKRANERKGERPMWALRKELRFWPRWDPVGEDSTGKRIPRDLSRYTNADYEPFRFMVRRRPLTNLPWAEYYNASVQIPNRAYRTDIISNSRNGELTGVPCALWLRYQQIEEEDEEAAKQFLAGVNYAFEVTILEPFHITEVKKDQRTYENWNRCDGVDRKGKSLCKLCDDGGETIFGRKVVWTMWGKQLKQLQNGLDKFYETCHNEECSSNVRPTAWYCANEDCEHLFGEEGNEEEGIEDLPFSEADTKEWLNHPVKCPKCKKTAMLAADLLCEKEIGHGSRRKTVEGCDTPVMAAPWDCVIEVRPVKNGKSNNLEVLSVEYIEAKDREVLTGVPPVLAELDMEALYCRMGFKEQMEQLGMTADDVPFDPNDGERAFKAYFATPADKDDADSGVKDDSSLDDDDDDDDGFEDCIPF